MQHGQERWSEKREVETWFTFTLFSGTQGGDT